MQDVRCKTKWDCDDILWNLCEAITEILNLNFDDWVDFKVSNNPGYTASQQAAIFDAFQDVEVFKKLRFYPGVDKIARIRAVGGEVVIKSTSLSEEVLAYKEWLLPKVIPGITKSDLELNLVTPGSTNHKKYEEGVLVAVDDSPYNIANSAAEINLMPIWQPWSRSKQAIETVTGKNVVWLPSLESMIDYTCQQCQLKQLTKI